MTSYVKLSYFEFTRTSGKVVVSECHLIPSPVNLIGYPIKCVGTANLVVKLSVTHNFLFLYLIDIQDHLCSTAMLTELNEE